MKETTEKRVSRPAWAKVLIGVVIALVVLFVALRVGTRSYELVGQAMEPAFRAGDVLFAGRLAYASSEPKRGDVVAARLPDSSQPTILRIAGTPGDTIRLTNGKVIVSNPQNPAGQVQSEPYVAVGVTTSARPGGPEAWSLGPDQYFLLADNRLPGKARDSRDFGPVNRDAILDKLTFRAYPLSAFGTIKGS